MKTAFVTGASRGIGRGIALALSRLGYRLALAAKDRAALEATAASLTNPLIFPLDVCDELAVHSAIEKTYKETGRLDVLVNGAGVMHSGTSELSSTELKKMFEVNLLGSFYAIQAAAKVMKPQRSGYIFNLASRAGKTGIRDLGGYSSSKFAVMGLNDSLCYELAEYGIKVTALCPGWVKTDMAAANARLEEAERLSVDDIVKAIEFLLTLSPQCCVREVVMECRKALERA